MRAVLRRLGEAAEVSRVYIIENHWRDDGEIWATQRYEWVAPGVSAQIENPLLNALPYRAPDFGRWVEMLGQGELVYSHTRDFPESEQPELRAEEILSIVVVPIFVEGRWWGFVGFDECLAEREWSPMEMDALKAAASTLGAAVRRRRAEDALRESEERYSLVVGVLTTVSSTGTSLPVTCIGTTGSTRCLSSRAQRSPPPSSYSSNCSTRMTAKGFWTP